MVPFAQFESVQQKSTQTPWVAVHVRSSEPGRRVGAREIAESIAREIADGRLPAGARLPPVRVLKLWPDGTGRVVVLGNDLAEGQVPQLLVPAGVWQGSRLMDETGFALLGCTVAPGFDYADYTGGGREALTAKWPAFADEIARLTPRG